MRRTMLLVVVVAVAAALAVSGAAGSAGSGQARWVIRDLGTLPGMGSSEAVAVNERGQVVGASEDGDAGRHGFIWQGGKMTALGTLGGNESWPTAINDRGQVVGSSTTKSGRQHAFLWENGKMRDLGTLPGSLDSAAYSINERGQIVGDSETKGFIWQNGKMTDLGAPGDHTNAHAINERGQVLGWSGGRAFLWEKGRVTSFGTLPGGRASYPGNNWAYPDALNDRGQAVGKCSVATRFWHACLWQNGRLIDLRIPPADRDSEAAAINNHGQIVGLSSGRGVFLWKNGRRIDLGFLASGALVINDRGQIAGTLLRAFGRAFIWEKGRTLNLPSLGDGLYDVRALNEHNQIVGSTGTSAVLWTLRSG